MDLDNITVDSSLMYPTTSRRFLMALWEMDGKRVALVPRAVQEMYGFVRQSEERFCQRALHKQTERTGRIYSPGDRQIIIDADQALEEAGHWTTQPTKLLEAVLRAALPSRPRSVERENEIVIQFITRLGREGWKHIAVACDEEWRSAEAEIAYTSARAFIAEEGSHARDTEARRIERIRKATSNAGYDIGR